MTTETNVSAPTVANANADNYSCEYMPLPLVHERMLLVVFCGSSLSIMSFLQNSLILAVFLSQTKYRQSNCLYLILLACFDLFMAVSYILLMTISVLIDYTEAVQLNQMWYSYVRPMITLSHVAMTSSTYLILAAVFEQYLETMQLARVLNWVRTKRHYLVCVAMFIGMVTKSTLYFEYQIWKHPECAGELNELEIGMSELAQHALYTSSSFYVRTVGTAILPFFLLAYFNVAIVLTLRRKATPQNIECQSTTTEYKNRARRATRILVLVVCCYLMANALTVTTSIMDKISDNLKQYLGSIYYFTTDIQSLLTIVGCWLRLFIYCACRADIRKDIKHALGTLCICWRPTKPMYTLNNNNSKADNDHDRRCSGSVRNGHAPAKHSLVMENATVVRLVDNAQLESYTELNGTVSTGSPPRERDTKHMDCPKQVMDTEYFPLKAVQCRAYYL